MTVRKKVANCAEVKGNFLAISRMKQGKNNTKLYKSDKPTNVNSTFAGL